MQIEDFLTQTAADMSQKQLPYEQQRWRLSRSVMSTLATPWAVARHAPLPMGFSRRERRSGLLFPSPGDLPNPGIEPRSPALQADALPTEL